MPNVTSILVIGADPASVAEVAEQPPGMTTQDVMGVIERQDAELRAAGYTVLTTLIARDGTSRPDLQRALAERAWDLIVVGAGIHVIPPFLPAFEAVMNAVHASARQREAQLVFATSVSTVTEAVRRKVAELSAPA